MSNVSITEQELAKLSKEIASKVKVGDVLALYGDLGSGKTTFSKYFINHLLETQQDITSPTFNLLHIYDGKQFPIWHFDLYRLKNIEDIYDLDIDTAFSSALSIIEWPEIIEDILPKNVIRIKLSFAEENKRFIEVN